MDDFEILGSDEDRSLFKQMLAQQGAPAFVLRARGVEEALERLVRQCERQREEWLPMVRTRLGTLRALAGDWPALRFLLADDAQLAALRQMETALAPRLKVRIAPTSSPRALRKALEELCASIERFNRRWQNYLPTVDVSAINALRDGYNSYYLVEKECAVGSARVARQGFHRLEPLTVSELTALLPLLPVPRLQK